MSGLSWWADVTAPAAIGAVGRRLAPPRARSPVVAAVETMSGLSVRDGPGVRRGGDPHRAGRPPSVKVCPVHRERKHPEAGAWPPRSLRSS